MDVTFDTSKDAENLRKHGVSLKRAEDFDMTTAAIAMDDREDYGEVRYKAIGFLDATLHVLVFTIREDMVRAISLRRATKKESEQYAEEF